MNTLTALRVANVALAAALAAKAHVPGDMPEDHEANTYGLPEGAPIRRQLRRTFREQLQRVVGFVSKIGVQIPDYFPSLADYNDPMASAFTPILGVYWSKAGKALNGRLGLDPDEWRVTDPNVHKAIARQSFTFCAKTNATTDRLLATALADLRREFHQGLVDHGDTIPQLTKRVQSVFVNASKYRAQMIAQTEASRAVHDASEMSAIASGVVASKRILLSANSCPTCVRVAAEARAVPLGGSFGAVGHSPEYGNVRMPPIHPHCRCSVLFDLIDESAPPVPAFVPKDRPAPAQAPAPDDLRARFPGLTIPRSRVAEFTRDSAEKGILIHRTQPKSAADILENGIDLEKANGVYGQGLYASTRNEKSFGPASVEVVVDTRNPLKGDAEFLYGKWREWGGGESGFEPAKFSEMARSRGYDAIITGIHGLDPENEFGTRWVVISNPDRARFVVDPPEGSP